MAEKQYTGARITIRYDGHRCQHFEECVHGAPLVFDGSQRPWINPDGDPNVEHTAAVIRRCPSGALHYTLVDGPAEEPDPVTTVTPVVDGPLLVRGDLRLDCGSAGTVAETRAALCRCGQSSNKPFCDGSHERTGWRSEPVEDPGPSANS
jgi:uncharacterized Fe-S cluster protein YjdI/CDGSH-type Zn-finger protein